jgi:hypothetical protein
MNLIETLQQQHLALQQQLDGITLAIQQKELAGINQKLTTFNTMLSEHLALEDAELYPGLERLASQAGDTSLLRVANAFASSMSHISDGLRMFLNRYKREVQPNDLESFSRDWQTIMGLLKSRITSEEKALYPAYLKASNKLVTTK